MSENNKEEMVKLTQVVFPWGAGYGNWSCQRPKITVVGRQLVLPQKENRRTSVSVLTGIKEQNVPRGGKQWHDLKASKIRTYQILIMMGIDARHLFYHVICGTIFFGGGEGITLELFIFLFDLFLN